MILNTLCRLQDVKWIQLGKTCLYEALRIRPPSSSIEQGNPVQSPPSESIVAGECIRFYYSAPCSG